MKIDLYTKGVLTVIAACLVYLCLGKPAFMPTAHAQTEPTKVLIAGWVDFNGRSHAFSEGDPSSALPVVVVPKR